MQIMADRLRALRQSINVSQNKLASVLKLPQSGINRYENNQCEPSAKILLRYADFFDVSLDYLYGRTDNPKGKVYSNEPDLEKLHPEMDEFIEMCFDPKSPLNKKLKKTLLQMLAEGTAQG